MKKIIQTLLSIKLIRIFFKIDSHLLMTKYELLSHALNSPINNNKKSLNLLFWFTNINPLNQHINIT